MIGINCLGRKGRFANQMFQYAAIKGIAAKRGLEWCIPPGPMLPEEFKDEYLQHKLFLAFELSSLKTVKLLSAPHRQEAGHTFDPYLFEHCEDNVSLDGHFQSELYFRHIADAIRLDFTWKERVMAPVKELFQRLVPQGRAISLHVRRTDHLLRPNYRPVLPMHYYEEALACCDSDLPVLVFSDDPQWCRQQPLFASGRFIIPALADNIADLCLMSLCPIHIIANSTFSWWGAWLSGSDHVVASGLWFGAHGHDARDLRVPRWRYLEV